jgi:hypothetical protein
MANALGTQMGGLPVSSKASVPDYASQIGAIDTEMKQNLPKIKEGFDTAAEVERLKAQQKTASETAKLAEETKGLQKYRESIADSEVSKQINQVIEQRNKPFVPTQESQKDLMSVFTLTTLIGLGLGGLGKQHSQQAISAMNGMLEGHIKGRDDLYKREKDVFEENSKALDRLVSTLQVKKQEILELAKTDYQAAQLKAEQVAMEAGAPFLADITRKQGVVKGAEYLDSLNKQLEKQKESLMRLYDASERRKEAERSHAEQARHNREVERQVERKVAKEALPLIQGVRGIEELQTKLRDPEVQKGWASTTAPLLEKIQSIDFTTDTGEVTDQINQKLTSTDKTTLFLKDAMIRAYEIERAAKGGGKLTVQDVRTLGPVLNPASYTPQAYNQLLETRRRSLYENLQDLGVPASEIQRRTTPRPYTEFGGQPAAPAAAPTQPVDPLGIR